MLGAAPLNPFFAAMRTGFNAILSWITSMTTALVVPSGGLYGLLPLFVIGISISAILLAIVLIRRIIR